MDTAKFLTTKFDQLSVKTQTAVEWIEQHHSDDLVEIGHCKCHRAGDKTAYAWIQNLPLEIEVGCKSKGHLWKDIVLVEELDRIGPKDRTAMKHLKSTLQWWKIHRIASEIEPYAEPPAPTALETTLVDLPSSEVPNNKSGSSQFAITSGSQSKNHPPSTTQANVATLIQIATVAYRVNYLGGGFFEQKVRKAWQDKNPVPLIQAMTPFIDLLPGFSWITAWLHANGGDPVFIALLVEVLKQTFANIPADSNSISSTPTATSPVVLPQIKSKPVKPTDDRYQAARVAFDKRMLDKSKKGGFGGSGMEC